MTVLRAVRKAFLIVVLLVASVAAAFGLLHIFGFLVLGILAFTVCLAVIRAESRRKRNLLQALAAAAQRGMPLAPVIEAHGKEYGHRTRRQTADLASLLHSGHSLSVAAHCVPGLLPWSAQAPIRLGEAVGDLPSGLRLAAGERASDSPMWTSLAGKFFYVNACFFIFIPILAFVFLKIVPAYQAIFDDFEMKLPRLTQTLIATAGSFAGIAFILFLPAVLFGGFLLLYTLVQSLGAGAGGFLFSRRSVAADVMEAMALGFEKRRPSEETLSILADYHVDGTVRARLVRSLAEIEGGRQWTEALKSNGIFNATDIGMFHAAAMNDNLAWALRHRAETIRRRRGYRLCALLQVVFPLVIGLLGLFVGFVVIGLFLPLVSLIQALV